MAICIGCGKQPHELEEYVAAAADAGMTPEQYVMREEGTFNRANGHFTCTPCYVARGCPTLPYPKSWVAP